MTLTNILLVLALAALGILIWLLWQSRRTDPAQAQQKTLQEQINLIGERQAGLMEANQKNLQAQLSGLAQSLTQQREATATSLGALEKNLSTDLAQQREKISTNLSEMHQRLAVIDRAQKNIAGLEAQTRNLQQILDNPQSRGAFGEIRLEELVRDMLAARDYAFQHTLSNGKRVDCLIRMPHPPGPVPIDSKFPLTAWTAWQDAKARQDPPAIAAAGKQLKADILSHGKAIAERYLIDGETADSALMFLPSESIFSALHIDLPDAMRACRALRVYPVSPNTMWMTLNTVRAIIRDVAMHEQARAIQKEVGQLLKDVARMDERIGKLRHHFDQANQDIQEIETSLKKITARGGKIDELEFDDAPSPPPGKTSLPPGKTDLPSGETGLPPGKTSLPPPSQD